MTLYYIFFERDQTILETIDIYISIFDNVLYHQYSKYYFLFQKFIPKCYKFAQIKDHFKIIFSKLKYFHILYLNYYHLFKAQIIKYFNSLIQFTFLL